MKDWLVAINDSADSGSAKNMKAWIKKELSTIGLSSKNITVMAADNETTNKALADKLKTQMEGCCVHLIDLIGDDAWESLGYSWAIKVRDIITKYLQTPTIQEALEARQKQSGKRVIKLIPWNETRWLGKPLALHRLNEICEDEVARKIIGFDFTEAETRAMQDMWPLMDAMARLIVTFSREKHIFPMLGQCTYGSHYRFIQQTYLSCVLHLATLDWDSMDATERDVIWKFGRAVVEGFEKRFFVEVRDEAIIGYFLDKGDVVRFGFGTFPELENLFLKEARFGANLQPSDVIAEFFSADVAVRIFGQAPKPMHSSTPITTCNIISHLKHHYARLHTRWTQTIASPAAALSAFQTYVKQHPVPFPTNTTLPFTLSASLATSGALRLLDGRTSPNKATVESQAADEWQHFLTLSLPAGFINSMQWACDESTQGFPTIRHVIKLICSRPYVSVPVEQVFSVARHQTNPYSSTLNADDYETRVILAFNRRNYDFEEIARLLGVSGFTFKHLEAAKVKEAFGLATGVKVGASARRNTEQARAAKAQHLQLKRGASAPPGLPSAKLTTSVKRTASKRSRQFDLDSDSEDEDLSEVHFITRTQSEREAQRKSARQEDTRAKMLRKLEAILANEKLVDKTLKDDFQSIISKFLSSVPNAGKLYDFIPRIRLDKIQKFVQDLRTGVAETTNVVEAIDLSLVEIDSILADPSSSGVSVVRTESAASQFAQSAASTASTTRRLFTELVTAQSGMSDLQAFLITIQQSFEQCNNDNAAFQAELEKFKKYLRDHGCVLVNVPSDGNCLYHAICIALAFHRVADAPTNHEDTRAELVAFMKDQDDDWFELGTNETKAQYLAAQQTLGEWGDVNVVRAAAFKYRRVFNVVTADHGLTKIDGRGQLSGRRPAEIQLLLVSLRHYMFGCPEAEVGRILAMANATQI